MLLGTLIYGFINSVILALIALGFSLTFGISGVSNFAYGSMYVLAGYAVWILMHKAGIPFIAVHVISNAILFPAIVPRLDITIKNQLRPLFSKNQSLS